MNSIENKIKNVTELTESQIDRANLQVQIQMDLIQFMRAQIDKVSAQNTVKAMALEAVKDRLIEAKETGEQISWSVLINLISVTGKLDNEVALGLFDIIKGNQKVIIEKPVEEEKHIEEEKPPEIDNKTLTEIKDFMSIMKNIKKGEFKNDDSD